jgi:hypothetical protein
MCHVDLKSLRTIGFVILFCFIAGCKAKHRLRPMTVGFQECELIFSIHDRCMKVDEEESFIFSFKSDHPGVSFKQDNLSLSAKDFSSEDIRGCHYTQEYRISYQAGKSHAPEFKWNILEKNKNWNVFPVQFGNCVF